MGENIIESLPEIEILPVQFCNVRKAGYIADIPTKIVIFMGVNMLSEKNRLLLQKLTCEHKELAEIIKEINEEHQYTISKIAHEISNPLTLINSSLQFIESHHPEVKEFQFWSSAIEDINYLRVLLTELSTFNNSENVNLETLTIEDIIISLESSFKPKLSNTKKKLIVNFSDTSYPIIGDLTKLRQTIINLLKNAFESIEDDGIVQVTVTYSETDLLLTISDTGIGMSEEEIEKIFTPFSTTKPNGTGLGLPISQKIIESHGGTINVTSAVGKGTVFRVLLPLM